MLHFYINIHFLAEMFGLMYAKKQHTTKVVLVDGESLAKLMIEYNLGVSTQAVYQIKRLDSDFFSEDND